MRGNKNEDRLKNLLLGFLDRNENELPKLKARIMDLNPLKISDDNHYFFEIANFSREIETRLEQGNYNHEEEGIFVITLKKWKFKFCKIPNKQSYFFDILISDFDCDKIIIDDKDMVEECVPECEVMEESKLNIFHNNVEDGLSNKGKEGKNSKQKGILIPNDLDSFGAISVDKSNSGLGDGSRLSDIMSDNQIDNSDEKIRFFKLFLLENMINVHDDQQVKNSHRLRAEREIEKSKFHNGKISPFSSKKKKYNNNSPLKISNSKYKDQVDNRSTAVSEQSKGFKSGDKKLEGELETVLNQDSTSKSKKVKMLKRDLMKKFNLNSNKSVARSFSRGLGLSGPKGNDNMQKLIEQRKSREVLVDSQSSITDHFKNEQDKLFGDDEDDEDEISIFKKENKKKETTTIDLEEENSEDEGMMIEDLEENDIDNKTSEKALNFIKQSTFGNIMNTFGNYDDNVDDDDEEECFLNKKKGPEISFKNSSVMDKDFIKFEDLKDIMDKRSDLLGWKELEFGEGVVNYLLDNFEEIHKKYT